AARRWRQAPPSSATSTSKAATRDAPTPLPTAAARAITLPAKSGGDLCPDLVLKIGAYVACQSRPFVFVRIVGDRFSPSWLRCWLPLRRWPWSIPSRRLLRL